MNLERLLAFIVLLMAAPHVLEKGKWLTVCAGVIIVVTLFYLAQSYGFLK